MRTIDINLWAQHKDTFFFINIYFLAFFYGFIDRTAEDMTGKRERVRERE